MWQIIHTNADIAPRVGVCARCTLCLCTIAIAIAECVCAPITIVSVTFSKSWGFMAAKSKQTDWGN